METITFKKKEYQVLQQLGDTTYKVSFKNKIFVIKTFKDEDMFDDFLRNVKRFKLSGVKIPKVIKLDKVNYLALLEFVEGKNVFDVLCKQDLTDEYFKSIFEQSWLADHENIALDFHPDQWIMNSKNEVVYMPFTFTEGIDPVNNFKTVYVKFWFFTKEFYNYAASKGVQLDKNRLQDEYKMNKEIVLTVVKYYI